MIIYGLVAKKGYLIADYSQKDGDFESLALKLLQKSKPQKQTYTQQDCQFTFFIDNEYQFLCVSSVETDKQSVFMFLDNLNEQFQTLILDQSGKSLASLTSNTIKSLIENYENQQQQDILQQTENELQQVTQIARQNIVEKGMQLDVLIDKTSGLKSSAEQMSIKSRKMKNQLLRQQLKTKIYMAALFIMTIIVIIYFK